MAGERRGRGLVWTIIVIVGLALLWVGYWYGARALTEHGIARANAGPIGIHEVACVDPAVSGMLVEVDVRCTRATYSDRGGILTAALGGIAATAPLYLPGHVDAKLDGPLVANAPGRGLALTVNWSVADASASAWLGGLTGASAAFDGLTVENAAASNRLPVKSVTADAADASMRSAGGGSYTLRANATRLALTGSDGTAYPTFDLSARVLAEKVGDLGTDPQRAFLEWLRHEPNARIERFRIAVDDLIVSAAGSLALDRNGTLNGTILLRYNSVDALGNVLETLKPGSRDKYQLALQGLSAMSMPVETEDGPMRQTTVAFRNGLPWLTVLPLPVSPIPPLTF